MQFVGLSMALGAFLAGVLLAESEYRRELETDIEPFKGLLLGLFFMAVGMGVDFGVLLEQPGLVALAVLGFLGLKAVVIYGLATRMGLPYQDRPVFTLLLAQGIACTVLDHDAEMIEAARNFGYRVFYGDASRLDLLRTAGAAKARILVLFEQLHPHCKDRAKLIAVVKQGRLQLEEQMARERAQRLERPS